MRLAQAGDVEAFGELVERNRRAVFRAALACVGSPTEADDVAQEAFVTAFRKLGLSRGLAVPHLAAVDYLAQGDRPAQERHAVAAPDLRASARRLRRGRIRLHGTHTFDGPLAGRAVVDDELQKNVTRLIGTLPRKLRDALLLAGSGEHTYDQISQMLETPVGTVKWRVSEARRVLKKKLTALGYAYE